uniref:Pentatricopeptide repeat-containing protein n=1 Tax=Rhizophora mucronata TaxID=61149 RepID=A0A2P2IT14_RHIMU
MSSREYESLSSFWDQVKYLRMSTESAPEVSSC